MLARLALALTWTMWFADAAAAQPASRPVLRIATASSSVAAQVRSAQSTLARATPAGTYGLSDVIKASYREGRLVIEIPEAVRQPGIWRLEIPGSGSDWVINSSGPQPAGFGVRNRYSSVTRYDLEDAEKDVIWSTLLSVSDHAMTLSSQFGAASEIQYMTLSLRPDNVRVLVTERNNPRAPAPLAQRRLTLTASSLLELRGKHPEEFRRFVAPSLRRMLGTDPLAIRATDAYRAFPTIDADSETLGKLRGLLERFQSPDAAARQKASGELAALGARGVLAALRTQVEGLTPEQRSRLDEFLESHDDRRFAGEQSMGDAWFLVDCLEFEDVRVRRAARQQLSRLLGHDVDFDPDSRADARAAAADRLRDSLAATAATRPATQPAPGGPR
jgi:hypothetical protein